MLLILKITIVPLFIGLITLAGRKWGSGVAGLMGAFPVVAGPIIIFITLEQGPQFAALTSVSAISATACLLIFGLVYSWACIHLSWFFALLLALIAWFILALTLALTKPNLGIALLIGGAVVTESVFAIPGLGRLTIDAIVRRDYPLIQGLVVVFSFVYVLVNLLVDVIYTVIDPRIRY